MLTTIDLSKNIYGSDRNPRVLLQRGGKTQKLSDQGQWQ